MKKIYLLLLFSLLLIPLASAECVINSQSVDFSSLTWNQVSNYISNNGVFDAQGRAYTDLPLDCAKGLRREMTFRGVELSFLPASWVYHKPTERLYTDVTERQLEKYLLRHRNSTSLQFYDSNNGLIFNIESTQAVYQLEDITLTNEWGYFGEGVGKDVIVASGELIQKGEHICLKNSYYERGSGLGRITGYTECLEYPSVNGTNITINNNKAIINYQLPYDPLTSNYTEGVVGCWDMDDATDYLGNYDLTNNGVTFSNGNAIFNSSSDYLSNANISVDRLEGSSAFTILITHNITSLVSDQSILTTSNSDTGFNYWYDSDSGGSYFIITDGQGESTKNYESALGTPQTTEEHVVITWDKTINSGVIKLYINDSLDTPSSSSGLTVDLDTKNNFIIGEGLKTGFTGSINQLIIWEGVALNSSQVSELYNSSNGVTCNSVIATGESEGGCTPSYQNDTVNTLNSSCTDTDFKNSTWEWNYWDTNDCGAANETGSFINQTYTCDFCVPSPLNTTPINTYNNTCLQSNTLNSTWNWTEYDSNGCFDITGLANDTYTNTSYGEINISSCTYSAPGGGSPTGFNITVIEDTYTRNSNPSTNYNNVGYLQITNRSTTIVEHSYLKPSSYLEASAAYLNVYVELFSEWNTKNVTAYMVTSTWNDTTLIWNTNPSINNTPLDSIEIVNSTTGWISFNITDAVGTWNNNNSKYGIVLKPGDGDGARNEVLRITESEDTENQPHFIFQGTSVQNHTLTVVNQWTGNPVNNISINISGVGIFTNQTGNSIYTNISDTNSYDIIVSANGYNRKKINNVNLSINKTFQLQNPLLTVTFKDSKTKTVINNANIGYWSDSDSGATSTTTGSLNLTLLQDNLYTLRYNSSGYNTNLYFISITNQSNEYLTLYLNIDSNTTEITVQVVDGSAAPVENVQVYALKHFTTTNTYEAISSGSTNPEGETVMNLITDNEFYKFSVIYNGVTVKTTSPFVITGSTVKIQVLLSEGVLEDYNDWKTIDSSLVYNPVSNNFRQEYTDNNNINRRVCLYTYRVGVKQDILINSTCVAGVSGTILHSITNSSGLAYYSKSYVTIDGTNYLLDTATTAFKDIDFEEAGLLGQIILSILLSLTGFIAIELLFITLPLSIILGGVLGLHSIGLGYTIPLLILGVIIMFMLRRNS